MLRNYLKIAWRNLTRQKSYAAINIFGLAIGLACCLVIALFVWHELSYDRFHEDADDIYRVVRSVDSGDQTSVSERFPAPVGPRLEEELPEVRRALRFQRSSSFLVSRGAEGFYESDKLFAEEGFFDVFSFSLLQGDPTTVLSRPYTLVLTERMAEKYFGEDNPIGQTLTIDEEKTYEITGVVEDPPSTSTLQFDFIASFVTQYDERAQQLERLGGWAMSAFPVYVQLVPETDAEAVADKILSVLEPHAESDSFLGSDYQMEPLTRTYLYGLAGNILGPVGDIRYVYIFATVAFLVLLLAILNYMNLTTARSARRSREVGVRKAVGAQRHQLAGQFMTESLLVSAAAMLVAVFIARLTLPFVEHLTNTTLNAALLGEPFVLLLLAGIALFVGLLAGSYPALILSSFQPRQILGGLGATGTGGASFRKSLIVFQFGVSAALLICTLLIWQQLDYIQDERLGTDREHVLSINTQGALSAGEAQTLRDELRATAGIAQATVSSAIPTRVGSRITIVPEGSDDHVWVWYFGVDAYFLDTFGMRLAAGRGFDTERQGDENLALLNEAAVRDLGWDDPIGRTITIGRFERTVVGVVSDFHFRSFHEEIEPAYFTPADQSEYVTVKLQPGALPGIVDQIGDRWAQFAPAYPLDYTFLDQAFAQLHESEQRIAQIFSVFFALAILIACLGLFGLAAFAAERRKKEIGIRKVLGATAQSIVALLSKDFLKLVLIGFVLAAPVAYYAMQRWLEDFAYRIDIGPMVFILAGLAAGIIALLTVSYQALRAALMNPTEAIRNE